MSSQTSESPAVYQLECIDFGPGEHDFIAFEEWEEREAALLGQLNQLVSAVEEYLLWEPRQAGHAAAHRKLSFALAEVQAAPNSSKDLEEED